MFGRILSILCLVAGASAHAGVAPPPSATYTLKTDPTVFLGLAWTFGNGGAESSPGVTLKVLSTNRRDAGAVAAGLTYNFDGTFGCDIGAAYNSKGGAVTLTWDFCRRGPQIGLGGVTSKPKRELVSSGDVGG